MNDPGGDGDNWRWRLRPEQLESSGKEELRELTETYGRAKKEK